MIEGNDDLREVVTKGGGNLGKEVMTKGNGD